MMWCMCGSKALVIPYCEHNHRMKLNLHWEDV